MSEKEEFDLKSSDIEIDNEIIDTFKTIKLLKRGSFDVEVPIPKFYGIFVYYIYQMTMIRSYTKKTMINKE